MTRSGALLLPTLLVVAMIVPASAQQNPVHWSATYPAQVVHPRKKFTVNVSARIAPGWHIYSITQAPGGPEPTKITVPGKQPFTLAGTAVGPRPEMDYDPNFQIMTEIYRHAVTFSDGFRPSGYCCGACPDRNTSGHGINWRVGYQ